MKQFNTNVQTWRQCLTFCCFLVLTGLSYFLFQHMMLFSFHLILFHPPSLPALFSLFLCSTVGLVLSVPGAGGRFTPATGFAVRGEMLTTWPASHATHARDSCPQERSSVWSRRRSCVGSTTTPWWRTSNGQLRAVRDTDPDVCSGDTSVKACCLTVFESF